MQNQITTLILAGGRGQRMQGADKGLMQWQGKTMIEHLIDQLQLTQDQFIISANRNISQYQQYTSQVIADDIDDFQGPLAGILSAMQHCHTDYLLCLPCDSPAPPENLQLNLWQCMQQQHKQAAVSHDGDRLQPLFSLMHCQYEPLLNDFMQQGKRKVHEFIHLLDPAICDFSAQKNAFTNFNCADDMQDA